MANEVRDWKPPFACYRCESTSFHITDGEGHGKQTVECLNCGLTLSGIKKTTAFGKPVVGVTVVDPDGTT